MRNISKLEKGLVKKLCDLETENSKKENYLDRKYSFDKIIYDICNRYNSYIIIKSNKGNHDYLMFNTKSGTGIDLANQRFEQELIEVLFFLQYLLDNRWIYTSGSKTNNQSLEKEIVFGTIGEFQVTRNVMDNNICDILKEFTGKKIYPTQSLVDFFNSGYQTNEDIKHIENMQIALKSLKQANWAMIISVILGVLSIVVSIYLGNE